MRTKNKILIVDDDQSNVDIIEEILEDNYVHKAVSNGDAALETMLEFQPDIILLDIMMPGINGYEVCKRVRADKNLKHIKIILVSAKASLDERLEGYESGADDYISKPYDEQELLAKICVFMKLKHAEESSRFQNRALEMFTKGKNTPLHKVLNLAKVLQCEAGLPKNVQNSANELVYRCENLIRVSQKTLLLCELRGQMQLVKKGVELKNMFEGVIKEFQSHAKAKGVSFNIENNVEAKVPVDTELFTEAFRYVVQNAVQVSPPKGVVTIYSQIYDKMCSVKVQDQGDGLRIGDQISKPLHVIANLGGQGLDLAIVQEIMGVHGGDLKGYNNKKGGATLELSIPIFDFVLRSS